MSESARPQLGRLIVTPFATIGVLAAVLMWEIEHVGSILLGIAITAGGVAIGVLVARQLRRDIDKVTAHYAALLRTADEQSRPAAPAHPLHDEIPAPLARAPPTPLNSLLA